MKLTVRGENLASLVACSELTRRGHFVRHLVSNPNRVGGFFKGVSLEEHQVDAGMVLIEPRLSQRHSPLEDYVAGPGNSVNEFNHHVLDWLSDQGHELVEVELVSLCGTSCVGDLVVADDLSLLISLSDEQTVLLVEELSDAYRRSPLDVRSKTFEPRFFERIGTISPEMYGATLSRFFLDLALKVGGPDSMKLATNSHRLLWLPLYHPATLLETFVTKKPALKPLRFLAPSRSGVASIIVGLEKSLNASPYYERVIGLTSRTDPANTTLIFEECLEMSNSNAEINSTGFGIALYRNTDSLERRVVHSVDPKTPWFRVSEGIAGESHAVVEVGFVDEDSSEQSIAWRANEAIRQLGIKTTEQPKVIKGRLFWPLGDDGIQPEIKTWKETTDRTTRYKSFVDTRSLNHQILLGLFAAMNAVSGSRQ